MPKLLQLIVACAENRVIGRARRLPWHIPEDLAFFHATTAGQICLLGRICYETWPRARLDGRRPIVLTRSPADHPALAHPGVHLAGDLRSALALAETLPGDLLICGGQRIYEETFALAAAENRPLRLHLTLIHAEIPGDTVFPEWRHLAWRELHRRESSDAHHRYTFYTLER